VVTPLCKVSRRLTDRVPISVDDLIIVIVLWNAAWGGLSTLARQPVSVMLEDENLPYTAEACRKIMLE
jgi:hypothetical protein